MSVFQSPVCMCRMREIEKSTIACATVTVSGTDQEDDVFELAQDGEPQDHLCITDGVEQLTRNFIRCICMKPEMTRVNPFQLYTRN